jgi:hypothetical protein
MKVVILNEHGRYLRRIDPAGSPHFSEAPLDVWQWDMEADQVNAQLKQINEQFGVLWTAETVLKAGR